MISGDVYKRQVNDIIKDIPIPNMVKVRQEFDRTRLEDVAAEVRKCLDRREILVRCV